METNHTSGKLLLAILLWMTCACLLDAQKLVTIGDSQTSLCGWQPSVITQTGYEWSREETTTGTNGHRAMAVGGSWLKPINNIAICLRGRDAIYYQPNKIIIYAGQNDGRRYWTSANNTGETPLEKVQYEVAYAKDEVDNDISTISAFKGLIEYLETHLPQTQIYLMTHVPVLCKIGMNPDDYFAQYYQSPRFKNIEDVIKFEQYERMPKDEYIRALGEYYDLPVIDLWKYSGITFYNTEQYYGEPTGDCTQVHLNQDGEELIAQCIADYLKHAPMHYDANWVPESYNGGSNIIYAEDFGVSPNASATINSKGLNEALARGGHIVLETPGTYQVSGTIYLTSNTTLEFGEGVILKRQGQWKDCMNQLFINQGAKTRVYDKNITIRGLNLDVNHVGGPFDENMIKGMASVLGFFYIKNLCIKKLNVTNLPANAFGLQVCTFDSLTIDQADIQGDKDGIHLGRGQHYVIRNCIFSTGDDPIALNGHDYVISNPEIGWIEDGRIENCTDLEHPIKTGYFCRMLAGSWCDWRENMEVKYGDAVVSNGCIYRLMNQNDTLTSVIRPCHATGEQDYTDGCKWYMQQNQGVGHDAGVRNLHFDNIKLQRQRDIAFSFHLDNNSYSHSFYPGAQTVIQTGITFEHIEQEAPFKVLMAVTSPVDTILITDSHLKEGTVSMRSINTEGCIYDTTIVVLKNVELPDVTNFISPNVNHPAKLIVSDSNEEIEGIKQDSHDAERIYNVLGQPIAETDNAQLPKGLYIIKGKKRYYIR